MAWTHLDDGWWSHPKVIRAGNGPVGAWVRMLNWSRAKKTDGCVPKEIARTIASRKELQKLVDVVLLERDGDGYRIHDHLQWNRSAAEDDAAKAALSARRSDAAKKGNDARWGNRKPADGSSQTNRTCDDNRIANGVVPASQNIALNLLHLPLHLQDLSQRDASHPVVDDACASPSTGEVRKKPAPKKPRPDISRAELSDVEVAAALIVERDSDLAPIVARPNQLARDLLAAGPGVDVVACVVAAGAWLRANPARQKRNGAAFLLGWVRREQERRREAPVSFAPRASRHAPAQPGDGTRSWLTGDEEDALRAGKEAP